MRDLRVDAYEIKVGQTVGRASAVGTLGPRGALLLLQLLHLLLFASDFCCRHSSRNDGQIRSGRKFNQSGSIASTNRARRTKLCLSRKEDSSQSGIVFL